MFCFLCGIDPLTEVLRHEINDRSGAFAAIYALELELEPKSAENKRKERQMKSETQRRSAAENLRWQCLMSWTSIFAIVSILSRVKQVGSEGKARTLKSCFYVVYQLFVLQLDKTHDPWSRCDTSKQSNSRSRFATFSSSSLISPHEWRV